jgi:alanyl-tRNA synthetase
MTEHREISRARVSQVAVDVLVQAAAYTAAKGPPTLFVGYEKTEALTAISVFEPLHEHFFRAKLFESPFYAEGGGQVTDQGFIEHEESGARARLVRADRLGDDQVLTFEGPNLEGTAFAEGDRVKAVVDWHARFPTMANHTATHLLHGALREVLGEHVVQAGSAVRPDKLRFDFTHGQALSDEERDRVEQLVNERVFTNLPVRAFVTPIDEARKLGAMMLFGEKYGDEVRVVEIDGISRELCGGTHVTRTAEIGPFVISHEGSVGAGTRRIEALTAGEAYVFLREKAREAGELRAELAAARKQSRTAGETPADFEITRQTQAGDVQVLVVEVRSGDPLDISDRLKQQHAPAAVIVGARDDGSVQLLINVDKSLEARGVHAGNVIREAAALVGGAGGGRPTMARAGGKDAGRLGDALAEAERLIVAALT